MIAKYNFLNIYMYKNKKSSFSFAIKLTNNEFNVKNNFTLNDLSKRADILKCCHKNLRCEEET